MRGRTLRLLIFSLVILGLAIVALGFSDINVRIPGVGRLERGGTGPLGLKLGAGPARWGPPGLPGRHRLPHRSDFRPGPKPPGS